MGWGGEGKNPDIVLITVLNFRWEKPCSFREKRIFWKFRHDARKIYNNLFIMFNLTLTRKPSLWGRQLYFHPDDVQLRFSPSLPVLFCSIWMGGIKALSNFSLCMYFGSMNTIHQFFLPHLSRGRAARILLEYLHASLFWMICVAFLKCVYLFN